MTHVASPDILYNRHEVSLQRESMKIIKVNAIGEKGTENLFTKLNHPDLGEENYKTQFNSEIGECNCCGGKHHTLSTLKKDIHSTGECFCPSEGNIQNFNDRVNKNPDGLPMSIGQAQHD